MSEPTILRPSRNQDSSPIAESTMDLQRFYPLHWRKSYLIALLAAFIALWLLFFDTHSIWTRYQLHQQQNHLSEQIEALREQTERLQAELDAIRQSPDLLERIAREEYGMRREGETVYRVLE